MSLRTPVHRAAVQRGVNAPASRVPLCRAESGPCATRDDGGRIPEGRRFPCAEAAAVRVAFTCPCGHDGECYLCAVHAGPGARSNCARCGSEYGHRCLVTMTTIAFL